MCVIREYVNLIQPIFVPDDARLVRNLDSLKSLLPLFASDRILHRADFGGWNTGDRFNIIADFIRSNFPLERISITEYSQNMGKAHIVNDLARKVPRPQPALLLLCDSDIIFPSTHPDIITTVAEIGIRFASAMGQKLGMLALNQSEHNCHLSEKFINVVELKMENGSRELVKYPDSPSGIAGGCLLTTFEMFANVGGYRELGVYAGEDAHYLLSVAQSGGCFGMAETCAITHPYDHDYAYAQWKRNAAETFVTHSVESYNASQDHADQFWTSKDS